MKRQAGDQKTGQIGISHGGKCGPQVRSAKKDLVCTLGRTFERDRSGEFLLSINQSVLDVGNDHGLVGYALIFIQNVSY